MLGKKCLNVEIARRGCPPELDCKSITILFRPAFCAAEIKLAIVSSKVLRASPYSSKEGMLRTALEEERKKYPIVCVNITVAGKKIPSC
jgi:hypothetical protein